LSAAELSAKDLFFLVASLGNDPYARLTSPNFVTEFRKIFDNVDAIKTVLGESGTHYSKREIFILAATISNDAFDRFRSDTFEVDFVKIVQGVRTLNQGLLDPITLTTDQLLSWSLSLTGLQFERAKNAAGLAGIMADARSIIDGINSDPLLKEKIVVNNTSLFLFIVTLPNPGEYFSKAASSAEIRQFEQKLHGAGVYMSATDIFFTLNDKEKGDARNTFINNLATKEEIQALRSMMNTAGVGMDDSRILLLLSGINKGSDRWSYIENAATREEVNLFIQKAAASSIGLSASEAFLQLSGVGGGARLNYINDAASATEIAAFKAVLAELGLSMDAKDIFAILNGKSKGSSRDSYIQEAATSQEVKALQDQAYTIVVDGQHVVLSKLTAFMILTNMDKTSRKDFIDK